MTKAYADAWGKLIVNTAAQQFANNMPAERVAALPVVAVNPDGTHEQVTARDLARQTFIAGLHKQTDPNTAAVPVVFICDNNELAAVTAVRIAANNGADMEAVINAVLAQRPNYSPNGWGTDRDGGNADKLTAHFAEMDAMIRSLTHACETPGGCIDTKLINLWDHIRRTMKEGS